MTDSNKHALLQANAALIAGDNQGFLSACDDDIVWSTVGGTTLRGKDAVRAWMNVEYRQPPRFTVHRLIAEAEFVVVLGDIEVVDAAGKSHMHAYCDVWRFRSGKMVELEAYVI